MDGGDDYITMKWGERESKRERRMRKREQ